MELSDVICHLLCKIFETSLKTSCIPDDWKDAKISAIYKNGKIKFICTYRPISLISIVCKCMEFFLQNYVTTFMKDNGLLSPKLYGFISGRSTVLQLMPILDTYEIDRRHHTYVAYMDFKKAFDTVLHKKTN